MRLSPHSYFFATPFEVRELISSWIEVYGLYGALIKEVATVLGYLGAGNSNVPTDTLSLLLNRESISPTDSMYELYESCPAPLTIEIPILWPDGLGISSIGTNTGLPSRFKLWKRLAVEFQELLTQGMWAKWPHEAISHHGSNYMCTLGASLLYESGIALLGCGSETWHPRNPVEEK